MTQSRSRSRTPRSARLVFAAPIALSALALAAPASAQSHRGPLVVLGLRAPTGDDEAATNTTEALRRAARAAGFEVPNNSPQLEQSMAAFGCDDSLPADCLAQIANDLHATRMVYGSVRRQGRGREAQLNIEVSVYDNATHTSAAHDQASVPRAMGQDVDALGETTHRMVDTMLPPPPPEPVVPDPRLSQQHHEQPQPGAPIPIRRYIGFGLMAAGVGVAVVGLVAGIQQLALVNRYNINAQTNTIPSDMTFANYMPDVQDVGLLCRRAHGIGDGASPSHDVAALCDQHDALTVSQIVGYTLGGALVAGGLILVLTDHTGASEPAHESTSGASARRRAPARPQMALTPVLSPGYQGASFRLQF